MHHYFKKSLGQHFLINKSILKKIVSIEDIKDKIICEIGPGQGALTKEILQNKPRKLILIEKDKNLRTSLLKLQEKFKDIISFIDDDIFFSDRLHASLPLYGIRWVLIILNIFQLT